MSALCGNASRQRSWPHAFAQHVRADRADQARLLGERDEVGGRHVAAGRMPPAGERLDAAEPVAVEVDDRLELEADLAALQRTLQVALRSSASTIAACMPGSNTARSVP